MKGTRKNGSTAGGGKKTASEKGKIFSVVKFTVLDILVAALIFGVFFLFLYVIPQQQQFKRMQEAMAAGKVTESTPTP